MKTKKFVTAIIAITLLSFALNSCSWHSAPEGGSDVNNGNGVKYTEITDKQKPQGGNKDPISKYSIVDNCVPQSDVVKDAKTAAEIALAVLTSEFGSQIKESMPFLVEYDKEFDIWVVKGQLAKNRIGGVPIILISKADGKVLAMSHTK